MLMKAGNSATIAGKPTQLTSKLFLTFNQHISILYINLGLYIRSVKQKKSDAHF